MHVPVEQGCAGNHITCCSPLLSYDDLFAMHVGHLSSSRRCRWLCTCALVVTDHVCVLSMCPVCVLLQVSLVTADSAGCALQTAGTRTWWSSMKKTRGQAWMSRRSGRCGGLGLGLGLCPSSFLCVQPDLDIGLRSSVSPRMHGRSQVVWQGYFLPDALYLSVDHVVITIENWMSLSSAAADLNVLLDST